MPRGQFGSYVRRTVTELYSPLLASINGSLSGPGMLGTVLLCEMLLSYLPSGMPKDQPHQVLRGYELVPLSMLESTKRLDLRKFAEISGEVLYIPRPKFKRVWVPLTRTMLSGSARATAIAMLMFLDKLKTGRTSADAILKASEIVVSQFKRDLVDMRIVPNASTFKKAQGDG